jgi:hypothetical protein
VAQNVLLKRLEEEMLSPEGVALLERKVREHLKVRKVSPQATPKPKGTATAKKEAELEQLRRLANCGTLSPAVAEAAIRQAENELLILNRAGPAAEEKITARILQMLPRAAQLMKQRIAAGNAGLRDPRSIVQGRNVLFGAFCRKVPLQPGVPKVGEKPFLVARLVLNRSILLEVAAGTANCVKFRSGAASALHCDRLMGTRMRIERSRFA